MVDGGWGNAWISTGVYSKSTFLVEDVCEIGGVGYCFMVTGSDDKRIYGSESTWVAVSVRACEERVLLREARLCPWLKEHGIGHVGVMDARYPYEVKRVNQTGTFMLACLGGRGEVFVDGGWRVVEAGEAYLLPPYMANAFRCLEGEAWRFAWVRYEESPEVKPIADSKTPVRGVYDSEALERAVMGLFYEAGDDGGEKLLAILWCELLHAHVIKLAKPKGMDERLWRVWSEVGGDLGRAWTLGELADLGHLSEEHLRRLCKRDMGRSPMQHLIYLRMLGARELLVTGDATLDDVAGQVGYESGFAFSNTFKKWMGCRPSDLRG